MVGAVSVLARKSLCYRLATIGRASLAFLLRATAAAFDAFLTLR